MKLLRFAALFAATVISSASFADEIDRALEARIHQAVAPAAAKMKLKRDNSPEAREFAGVYYAPDGSSCRNAHFCTALVVYYEKGSRCERMMFGNEWGFIDHSKDGGNGRNVYNFKHKNVCYQISTQRKKDAQAVKNALKAKL